MSELVIRRLLVDLEAPFARAWCGGDAFRSALFDALSMSFPVGEQFFIDAVRDAAQALPVDAQPVFTPLVRDFVGQEATHRRLHALFNDELARQGLVNRWALRAEKRLARFEGADPRHPLAVTAAYEHFTAIFADWLLRNPEVLAGSEERLATFWLWHAAEECEHKCVAFDVYRALGGDDRWRLRWFRRVTLMFLTDATRQTIANLARSGDLWRVSTWTSAARLLFGRRGLVRATFTPWRRYFDPAFHPSHADSGPSLHWLAASRDRFEAIGGTR